MRRNKTGSRYPAQCQMDPLPMPPARGRWRAGTVLCIGAAIAVVLSCAAASDALAQTPAAKPTRTKLSPATMAAQHKVAIQVNQNDKATMDLALNNAKNVIDYYASKGETVAVEIVAYGPGLHMLRTDTSPVKQRISTMSLENSNLTFAACGNTQANQSKAENKPVTLVDEAKVTPSGGVRLMELQKQGYAYIRP
jgi:intracellular sulfur oxidation DsrE/DsrF family protein